VLARSLFGEIDGPKFRSRRRRLELTGPFVSLLFQLWPLYKVAGTVEGWRDNQAGSIRVSVTFVPSIMSSFDYGRKCALFRYEADFCKAWQECEINGSKLRANFQLLGGHFRIACSLCGSAIRQESRSTLLLSGC